MPIPIRGKKPAVPMRGQEMVEIVVQEPVKVASRPHEGSGEGQPEEPHHGKLRQPSP